MTTVVGRLVDGSGNPKAGPVSFIPIAVSVVDTDVIVESVTVSADENGEFSVGLEAGSYRVQIGSVRPFTINLAGTSGIRNLVTVIDAGLNYLTIPPGGGTPIATDQDHGIVKTTTTSADPRVPLASEVDARFEPIESFTESSGARITTLEDTSVIHAERLDIVEVSSAQNAEGVADVRAGGVNEGSIASDKLSTVDDDAKIGFGNLKDAVNASFGTALDATKYLGVWNPATNTPTIGLASANNAKWYVVSPAGTASGTNADATYTLNDVVVSNGTTWLRRPAPPGVVADGTITRPKLGTTLDAEVPHNESSFDSVALMAVLDAARKMAFWIKPDGTVCGRFNVTTGIANGLSVSWDPVTGAVSVSLGTADGEIPLGDHRQLTAVNNDVYAWALVDQDYRLAMGVLWDGTVVGRFQSEEIVDARGDEAALVDRLDKFTDGRGLAALHNYNGWTLRDWRRLAFDILLGTTGIQPVIAFFGDSWVWNINNFVTYLTRRLKVLYGTSGEGFQTFSGGTLSSAVTGPSDNANGSVTKTGTWSIPSAYDGRGPDISETTSSTVTDLVTATLSLPAEAAVISYLKKSGGGSFQWRINGGAWTSVSTANGSDALGTVTISSGFSTTNTLEVAVTAAGSTGVTLFGVDWKKTGSGARIHRCGHSGSRSDHWSAAPAIWDACVAQLAPHVAFIVLGTNDQAIGASEDNFKGYIEDIVGRLRAVRAGMDIVLIAPTENLAGRSTPMTTYRDALYRIAQEQRCGFLDLVRLFGDAATEYNQTSPRNLMDSSVSTVHLTAAGNKLAADAMERLLVND